MELASTVLLKMVKDPSEALSSRAEISNVKKDTSVWFQNNSNSMKNCSHKDFL